MSAHFGNSYTETNMNQISTGRVGHEKLRKVLLGFQGFL